MQLQNSSQHKTRPDNEIKKIRSHLPEFPEMLAAEVKTQMNEATEANQITNNLSDKKT